MVSTTSLGTQLINYSKKPLVSEVFRQQTVFSATCNVKVFALSNLNLFRPTETEWTVHQNVLPERKFEI